VLTSILKWLGLLFVGVLLGYGLRDATISRAIEERRAEIAGNLASAYVAAHSELDERAPAETVAGLQHIEVAVDQPAPDLLRASGVANTFLIRTAGGHLLFDTGLATQAAKHKRLLQQAAPGDITHIVLSHAHADHVGGTKFWLAQFPNAKVVAHAQFVENQRYLKNLEPYFWSRNRLLYPFMPEQPPDQGPFSYGGIVPDIEVAEGEVYAFRVGGIRFEAIAAAGAEGEDNLVLWLPERQLLFSGDFFGPLFPMLPNLFTLRGEKFRDPLAYVRSLDRLIGLGPQMVLPSHFDPVSGREQIGQAMRKMRDATRFLHEQTVAGMNQGKTLWQLMREVTLPPDLALSEGHGKVSWNVRSFWEYYATWFHFQSTTELYPVRIRELYPRIAELAGGPEALAAEAMHHLQAGEPEAALHWIELGLAMRPDHVGLLRVRSSALHKLLDRAYAHGGNYSETGWLKSRIAATEAVLAANSQQ